MSKIDINKYSFLKPREGDTLEDNLMFFGCDCGNGWDILLNSLFRVIEEHLEENSLPDFKFIQIKEKYGSLRLYYEGADNYIDKLCESIEQLSQYCCEDCGDMGEIRYDLGWYRALCDKHYLEAKPKKDVGGENN